MCSEDAGTDLNTKREECEFVIESHSKHAASMFADRDADRKVNGIQTKDEEYISRQSIFRNNISIMSAYGPSRSGLSPYVNNRETPQRPVLRSQTFDSSFTSSHHPCTPSKSYSFSYKNLPKRSPTFPFRPNAALCSFQSRHMTSSHETTPNSRAESPVRNNQIGPDDQFIKRKINLSARHSISFHVEFVGHEVSRLFLAPPSTDVAESGNLDLQDFPISAIPSSNNTYWWFKDAADLERELHSAASTEVIVGDDEIELVDSEESDCTTTENLFNKSSNVTIAEEAILNNLNSGRRDYSPSDVLILHDIIQNLKDDMSRSDNLDCEKKFELETLLMRLESTMSQDDMWTPTFANDANINCLNNHGDVIYDNKVSTTDAICQQTSDAEKNSTSSTYDSFRKPLVAITGGALVTTGVVLIPMPVVPGILVIYAGLSVLATEFEGARDALATLKEPLERFLADEEEVDETESNGVEKESTLWTDTVPSSLWCGNDIDDNFRALIRMKEDAQVHFREKKVMSDEEKEAAKKSRLRNNEIKRWVRKVLNLESGDSNTVPDVDSFHASVSKTLIEQKHRNQTVLLRFDSILSSYGEEVDEDGVTSDRLNRLCVETDPLTEKTLDSLCGSISSNSSTVGLNSRYDSEASLFAVGSCPTFFNEACAD
ncbi:hypothetical protein ACHAW6_011164 [Cyclotella cf. meneghiniana]